MKDKFWNISMQGAIAELTTILQNRQDKESRVTGFGHGFYRWVLSCDILNHLNSTKSHQFTFAEIRTIYKELAKRNLICVHQWRERGILAYSTKGWEGCENIGDYFIENESTDSH